MYIYTRTHEKHVQTHAVTILSSFLFSLVLTLSHTHIYAQTHMQKNCWKLSCLSFLRALSLAFSLLLSHTPWHTHKDTHDTREQKTPFFTMFSSSLPSPPSSAHSLSRSLGLSNTHPHTHAHTHVHNRAAENSIVDFKALFISFRALCDRDNT